MERLDRVATAVAALLMALLGFLPIANWIQGGHEASWYSLVAGEWLSGGALAIGLGVALAYASRRWPSIWRAGLWSRVLRFWEQSPFAANLLLALIALAIYALVAQLVFSARPLLIDEIVQVFQARTLAEGKLWLPLPEHPEFFSAMHLVEHQGRWYGQYPAGGPALLALGTLVGAEWLIGPLCAAVSVVLFASIARRVEPRPGVAAGAAALFALAPFVVFMSGTYMNHVTGLTATLLAWWALIRVTSTAEPRFRDALVLGLGLGFVATIRPLDAMIVALPAGIWVLSHAIRTRRLAGLLGSAIGLLVPIIPLLVINDRTNGAPLQFGYTLLWGKAHDPGFHETPWGDLHTPARGLELLNLYFLRLQTYFLELPIPSLLPAVLALAGTRALQGFDRYLLAVAAILSGVYFSYWHDGFYLGPRFMYPLVPFLAIWTARALPVIRDRLRLDLLYRGAVYSAWAAIALGLTTVVTIRAREYRNGMLSPRWPAEREARAAGVRGALIFVRESWGSQVFARLWAAGVSRADAQRIYQRVDTCVLDSVLSALDREGIRGPEATSRILPLLADSSRVTRTSISPDPTERVTRGRRYSEYCIGRVRENWTGFTVYPHLLLAGTDDNVYARDLQARDTLLLAAMPDRPVFLLKPAGVAVGAPPSFIPLSRDSLLEAWRKQP
jgi:hypothetical protein